MPVIALSQSNDDEELGDESSPAHVLGFGCLLYIRQDARPAVSNSAP